MQLRLPIVCLTIFFFSTTGMPCWCHAHITGLLFESFFKVLCFATWQLRASTIWEWFLKCSLCFFQMFIIFIFFSLPRPNRLLLPRRPRSFFSSLSSSSSASLVLFVVILSHQPNPILVIFVLLLKSGGYLWLSHFQSYLFIAIYCYYFFSRYWWMRHFAIGLSREIAVHQYHWLVPLYLQSWLHWWWKNLRRSVIAKSMPL